MLQRIVWIVAIFGVAVASAKTYGVTLSEPYHVGAAQFKPGDYRLTINGKNAVLSDWQRKVTATGTVAVEANKFGETAVLSNDGKGSSRLKAIQLRGTRLEIDFN